MEPNLLVRAAQAEPAPGTVTGSQPVVGIVSVPSLITPCSRTVSKVSSWGERPEALSP